MESSKPHQLQFSDFADLAEKYDYFLFDCDGVLWVGDQTIEHSFSALNYLVDKNKKVFFLTNSAMRGRPELMNEKLIRQCGFDRVPYSHLYTASYMAAEFLKQIVHDEGLKRGIAQPKIYAIAEPGFIGELVNAGLVLINPDDNNDPNDTMTEEELASFELDPTVVAVTVGINFTFNYRKLCIASLYINENKVDFIGTNPDRNTGNGARYIPGCGTIIKAIETATGVKAKIMGKPTTYMFDIIRKQHSLQDQPLSKFLMTGDNLQTDIKFGSNNDIDTLLVLTGCCQQKKAEQVILQNIYEQDQESVPTQVQPFLGYSPKLDNFRNITK